MRLLFAGSPDVALPTLNELAQQHEIVGVLTQPAKPRGRSGAPQQTAVAEFANRRGWRVLTPVRVADAADQIADLQPDIAVVVAYGQLLPIDLLSLPAHGWLNLHFSLLPHWRGAAPVQRAIIAGDDVTGASVFRLDAGMDSGPVLGQFTTHIESSETAGDLLHRLSVEGAQLVRAVVEGLAANQLVAVPQDADHATYAPKLLPTDAKIDWRLPAHAIDRLIRGCTPEPGAWTSSAGLRLLLAPVEFVPERVDLAPGELASSKAEVLVGTGSCAVRLGEVKPAGRKWMSAPAWVRGLASSPARLG